MIDFGVVLAIAAVVGFALVMMWWRHARSSALLQAWAEARGYRILRQQYRFFFTGPFFSRRQKAKPSITLLLKTSCGSWWVGLLSDKVQVRWED
jgi:hypothetical protein